MFLVKNNTPFLSQVFSGLDKNEYEFATVVIKGAFAITGKKEALPVSEEPVPVTLADQFYGEPGASSIQYASDLCLKKRGTDIVLNGHAYTRRPKDPFIDVTLKVGELLKVVRVFGDRHWYKFFGLWKKSPERRYEKIALRYEHAFGGKDTSHPDPARHDYEKRNPVGKGFTLSGYSERLEGFPLPNLEDPRSLIESWKDKPVPAGFGCVASGWMPRRTYAGTYDKNWRENRCPLLPKDFDDLFFNSAAPDLITRKYLKGGETVRITGASSEGDLVFDLPEKKLCVDVILQGKTQSAEALLDTVIIEPDEHRLILTWRAVVPVYRQFLHIDHVIIKETT